MFGFLIGTVSLIALIKVLRRGRHGWAHAGGGCGGGYGGWAGDDDGHGHGHGHGWGGGFARGGWGRGWGGWGGGFARGNPRGMMRWLFRRLETSPGQENVIVAAFEEVREALSKARTDLRGSATGLADALRAESLDASALGNIFVQHDSALGEVRKAVVGALAKVHDALDERQRAILAEVVESFTGRAAGGGHPYRSADPKPTQAV
ncbi:MAG TPA: periplasmic heavy metal sensor [Myxococcota bacterium]|jgi:hypothetical protein|nr:periplasmic heavy metal sensor [Myxococcota bacterium]